MTWTAVLVVIAFLAGVSVGALFAVLLLYLVGRSVRRQSQAALARKINAAAEVLAMVKKNPATAPFARAPGSDRPN